MRSALLSILLVCGSAILANAQQLKEITNSIGMKLVLIHPGSFTMGSPEGEEGRKDNEKPHEVTIDKPFYLGAHEVTQEQYEKVMGNNPSKSKGTAKPVENLSWESAISFCQKLTELPDEKTAGREYRLPTEAEWEYACRATSASAYCFGDSSELLDEYAWSSENSKGKTQPVGQRKPNRWGLYDMHGNVLEWCMDSYADYPSASAPDSQRSSDKTYRMMRGGSFFFGGIFCRSALRNRAKPSDSSFNIGFRVSLSLPTKQIDPASNK